MYDVAHIRQGFLGLSKPDEHEQLPLLLDGPGGSQLPKVVVDQMANYLYHFNSNLGGAAHAGRVTQETNDKARQAAGAWLNCSASSVFFGLNATSLMFHASRTIAQTWQAGDNIVLSSIDHFSHVSSWQLAAEDRGVQVRKIPLTADGSALDLSALPSLIDERTRLVAVSLASNVLGTKTKLAPITKAAHAVGAIVSVDAVHAIVHECVDVQALDCDVLFASAYKIGAARLGVCYMNERVLVAERFYKVEPATNALPNAWEQGTQSFEAQTSLIALLEYWANLGGVPASEPLRTRLVAAYQVVGAHELSLIQAFLDGVQKRDYIRFYGHKDTANRTPTFAFNLIKDGQIIDPKAVSAWFGAKNIALPSGNFYALDVVRKLDLVETGFLRVGFLHYNTIDEVARLFALLDECVASM
ncbi:aminotransferase class V-fold PLP-dependent enzyme [Moraxella sp. FZLJ2107]|uniref:aminotransferase class V-fold PLP-dependent enzyme n=1 Tax=unclassified Moraxella TaxID=2685852 RepID=UPI0020C8BAAF|nr:MULTISPECIES: aminotransferase class V-fold PLP-dependent enzyme [unclassified Moraxella]UTO04445.1 aminotransferase class V-fold PLP-dependent enzyme [Moraxella sp. FZLJ2107]UTO23278.1 aminotransferase class V-fold PLP-dependent enzyme [Moraxella sp. FZLJ2109]